MTSDQFIAFVERKLEERGVGKIVPDDDTLTKAYEAFAISAKAIAAPPDA